MKQDITVSFGLQECSKCEYKLRCEECANNPKETKERIKYDLNCFATRLDNELEKHIPDEGLLRFVRALLSNTYDEFLEERK